MRLSDNLGSHPVSVVPDGGMTFEMEKYFKRMNPEAGMKADRILELNADHPIFAKLQIAVAQDEKKAEDLVKILYTQALLMALKKYGFDAAFGCRSKTQANTPIWFAA